jgi:hypothetical protein
MSVEKADKHRNTARSFIIDVVVLLLVVVEFCVVMLLETQNQIKQRRPRNRTNRCHTKRASPVLD